MESNRSCVELVDMKALHTRHDYRLPCNKYIVLKMIYVWVWDAYSLVEHCIELQISDQMVEQHTHVRVRTHTHTHTHTHSARTRKYSHSLTHSLILTLSPPPHPFFFFGGTSIIIIRIPTYFPRKE